jgi:hypothetical protein
MQLAKLSLAREADGDAGDHDRAAERGMDGRLLPKRDPRDHRGADRLAEDRERDEVRRRRASASPIHASPPAFQSPPASTAQPRAATAIPPSSRELTRSPSSVPNATANIGFVATSAMLAAVDVNDNDAIHEPKCRPSSSPDDRTSMRSRSGSRTRVRICRQSAANRRSDAIPTRSAAIASGGAGAAQRANGAPVEIHRTARRRRSTERLTATTSSAGCPDRRAR